MYQEAAAVELSRDVSLKIITRDGSLSGIELFLLEDRSGNEIMFAREEELVWIHAELMRGDGCRSFSEFPSILDRTVAVNHKHCGAEVVSGLDREITCIWLGTAQDAAARIKAFMVATGHGKEFTLTEHPCDLFFALRWLKANDPCSVPPGSCKLLAKAIGRETKVKKKKDPCEGSEWQSVVEPVRLLMRYLHHNVEYHDPGPYEQLNGMLFPSQTVWQ